MTANFYMVMQRAIARYAYNMNGDGIVQFTILLKNQDLFRKFKQVITQLPKDAYKSEFDIEKSQKEKEEAQKEREEGQKKEKKLRKKEKSLGKKQKRLRE